MFSKACGFCCLYYYLIYTIFSNTYGTENGYGESVIDTVQTQQRLHFSSSIRFFHRNQPPSLIMSRYLKGGWKGSLLLLLCILLSLYTVHPGDCLRVKKRRSLVVTTAILALESKHGR